MEYGKPIPTIDAETKEFWAATAQGKLMIPHCVDCGRYHFYPRVLCPHCHSERVALKEVSGNGTIYSYTIHRRSAGPAFEADVPYTVALIDLDEGARMLSNVLGPVDNVKIGAQVKVRFEPIADGIALPKFELSP